MSGSHVRIDIDIITGSIRDNYLINQDIDLVNILTQLSGPAPDLSYLPSHINFHELLLLIQCHELHHNQELASLDCCRYRLRAARQISCVFILIRCNLLHWEKH